MPFTHFYALLRASHAYAVNLAIYINKLTVYTYMYSTYNLSERRNFIFLSCSQLNPIKFACIYFSIRSAPTLDSSTFHSLLRTRMSEL